MVDRTVSAGFLLLVGFLLVSAGPVAGQQIGASVSALEDELYDPDMALVSVPVSCEAWSFITPDGPMMELDLSVDLYVNGVLIASEYAQLQGYSISADVTANVSVVLQDVNVYCSAYGTLGGVSDQITLFGRAPGDVRSEEEAFSYYSLGSYLRTRNYRVWDNWGRWFAFTGTPVGENMWNSGQNGCNIDSYNLGAAQLNNVGRFQDNYGNTSGSETIPACQFEAYRGCVTEATQMYAIGDSVYTHRVEWRCDNVVVYR